jgi:hypothetical protein
LGVGCTGCRGAGGRDGIGDTCATVIGVYFISAEEKENGNGADHQDCENGDDDCPKRTSTAGAIAIVLRHEWDLLFAKGMFKFISWNIIS